MTPGAAMFTTIGPMAAMVPWNNRMTQSGSTQHLKRPSASPYDLIMQESISNLIGEVSQLRLRCEGLQNAKVHLTKRMTELECKFYDEAERMPLTKENLTGYASLYDSTEDPCGDHSSFNDDRFRVVGQLLEQYQQRLEASEARQAKMEKHLAELTTYQRSSEALFSALKHELHGLDVPVVHHDLPGPSPPPMRDSMGDLDSKNEQLRGRFEEFESKILAMVTTLEARLAAGRSSQAVIEDSNKTGLESSEKLRRDVPKLKHFAKAITRKHEHERLIDDAPTQDQLYRYYADLSSMANNSEETCGPFEGTTDEVWQLRDRVLCRLAIYDRYCEAFEEANKAVKEF